MPVDLFLPPLVAFLFPCSLYLVVFKIIFFLLCFFLKRSWRFNFPPNKRGRQRSWPCIFPPKNNPGYSKYAHLCKPMWNETLKPCAATRGFFCTLSCSFALCSSLMFRLFATALNRSLWRRTSLLRRQFSRSLSISLSLLYMFVDLFINWVCVLSCTSSSKLLLLFFLKRSWRCNFLPKNAAGSAVGHAFSRRKKLICSTRFECLISCWLTCSSVRTYDERSVGRKWRHNQTKISRTDGFTKVS